MQKNNIYVFPSHDFQRIHDKNNRAFTKKDPEDESIKEGYTFSQKSVVSCRRTSIVYLKKIEISTTLKIKIFQLPSSNKMYINVTLQDQGHFPSSSHVTESHRSGVLISYF